MGIEFIIPITILAVWLVGLTIYVFVRLNAINKFLGKKGDKKILKLIQDFDSDLNGLKKDNSQLEEKLLSLEKTVQKHIQKVGLVRFNPFEETGGDHSFSMALLNGKDTGIVITGLHTRQRTRIYVKYINAGKCEQRLSDEENKAIKNAK